MAITNCHFEMHGFNRSIPQWLRVNSPSSKHIEPRTWLANWSIDERTSRVAHGKFVQKSLNPADGFRALGSSHDLRQTPLSPRLSRCVSPSSQPSSQLSSLPIHTHGLPRKRVSFRQQERSRTGRRGGIGRAIIITSRRRHLRSLASARSRLFR